MIHDLEKLSLELLHRLHEQSQIPREKQRVKPEMMQDVLLALCSGHFITRTCLAELVSRDADSLRTQYLTALVAKGELALAFPQNPTHPRQAYIRASKFAGASDEELLDK